jgi:hypothetical protein
MSDESTELAVGESLVTDEAAGLTVETTRTEEHLFTTTYRDTDTGTLRLALQVDITTGRTAIDPRSLDASFWTLVVGPEKRPVDTLRAALGAVSDPSIEVTPEDRTIHVYAEEGGGSHPGASGR